MNGPHLLLWKPYYFPPVLCILGSSHNLFCFSRLKMFSVTSRSSFILFSLSMQLSLELHLAGFFRNPWAEISGPVRPASPPVPCALWPQDSAALCLALSSSDNLMACPSSSKPLLICHRPQKLFIDHHVQSCTFYPDTLNPPRGLISLCIALDLTLHI